MQEINIIGGGFAGSEAAWQLANRNIKVNLFEMRPEKRSDAHHSNNFAEVVCSNSLGSQTEGNASALIKKELKMLNSLIMEAAEATKVPAGGALAVDRELFSKYVTAKIDNHPLIEVHRKEITNIDSSQINIIATGPLTSKDLSENLQKILGEGYFHFFDAAAPIVEYDSLNFDIIFEQSRYDKGDGVYLNCPFDKEQYEIFWSELNKAELAPVKNFDVYETNKNFFEGCMPIEELARRGVDTPRFGPMKPVGLTDPKTGKRPYAVVQLRQDNAAASLYNLVGFQTQLKWGEQKRVFGLIPGLENADFVRYGVMHRNTYINSPKLLNPTLQLRKEKNIFISGLLTGVEGYIESCAMGALAGINVSKFINNQEMIILPETSMMGALSRYITNPDITKDFQPINSNWGIIKSLEEKIRDKKQRNLLLTQRALKDFEDYIKTNL
ncbi:MAG: methylenetetrahydrofolate--tRNA-(uracil(54)-C(5))-methyltransferase (FADH(2)-oxidizing) TrmFO [Candidatus Sericytochromatia bacterium]